jgi:hypothetical protein
MTGVPAPFPASHVESLRRRAIEAPDGARSLITGCATMRAQNKMICGLIFP